MGLVWEFEGDRAVTIDYPIGDRERSVATSDVTSVGLGMQPVIRIGDELLFVTYGERDELRMWALMNGVPVRVPFDVWSWLLEPFLDAEVDIEGADRRLQDEGGLDPIEIHAIRSRVGPAMLLYNFAQPLWDWVNLSHLDLLQATRAGLTYPDGPLVHALREQFSIPPDPLFDDVSSQALYDWSMAVALAAPGWD